MRHFHGERQALNFLGEDGAAVAQQQVIWYCFLVFKEPTSYGQIVVDAGNAEIPQYHVVSQSYFSSILRFNGDIGNITIEIRCAPANPAAQPDDLRDVPGPEALGEAFGAEDEAAESEAAAIAAGKLDKVKDFTGHGPVQDRVLVINLGIFHDVIGHGVSVWKATKNS